MCCARTTAPLRCYPSPAKSSFSHTHSHSIDWIRSERRPHQSGFTRVRSSRDAILPLSWPFVSFVVIHREFWKPFYRTYVRLISRQIRPLEGSPGALQYFGGSHSMNIWRLQIQISTVKLSVPFFREPSGEGGSVFLDNSTISGENADSIARKSAYTKK